MDKRNRFDDNHTDSAIKFELENDSQINYRRPLGSHKPKFEGIPDGYYPPTWGEGCLAACITYTWVIAVLGLMIGFMFWCQNNGTEQFIIVWVAIGLFWIVLMIVLIFFGSRDKKRIQREQVQKSSRQQKEVLQASAAAH